MIDLMGRDKTDSSPNQLPSFPLPFGKRFPRAPRQMDAWDEPNRFQLTAGILKTEVRFRDIWRRESPKRTSFPISCDFISFSGWIFILAELAKRTA